MNAAELSPLRRAEIGKERRGVSRECASVAKGVIHLIGVACRECSLMRANAVIERRTVYRRRESAQRIAAVPQRRT